MDGGGGGAGVVGAEGLDVGKRVAVSCCDIDFRLLNTRVRSF